MIFETLHILASQVNAYLNDAGMGTPVILENIAILDTADNNDTDLQNSVALTLINVEEEGTMKNLPNRSVEGVRVTHRNPKVYLNLYILFSANRNSYDLSLRNISRIIEYFQGKRIFTQSNTLYNRNDIVLSGISTFRFIIDLYTPSFEEMNFVWGTLGGRQLPSVMYKLTLVDIEQDTVREGGGLITEIQGETDHLNN